MLCLFQPSAAPSLPCTEAARKSARRRWAAAGIAKFDERTAHLLMAAADYVIIPSRFEPCGLVAQSAARYGAVPIVTAVGGLKDFVTDEVQVTA